MSFLRDHQHLRPVQFPDRSFIRQYFLPAQLQHQQLRLLQFYHRLLGLHKRL
jgi:hypothetical protein